MARSGVPGWDQRYREIAMDQQVSLAIGLESLRSCLTFGRALTPFDSHCW